MQVTDARPTVASGQDSWSMANRHLAERFLGGVSPWAVKRGTYIVVPSLSLGNEDLLAESGADPVAEQRLLSLALLLHSPDVRVIYASSYEVPGAVIDTLMRYVPDPDAARSKFGTVTTSRPGPLASALLADPRAMEKLRAAVRSGPPACLISFDVTRHESALAASLGIPVIGSHPDHQKLCTKTGARQIAIDNGVPVPPGAEGLGSLEDAEEAVERLGSRHPRVIVKLNDGFGGLGNVVVDSSEPGIPLTRRAARFGDPLDDWASFSEKFERSGGVVEVMVGGGALASPSAQLFISPEGQTLVVSTQDQIMGGPTGQTSIGCAGPASLRYRYTIARHAAAVGDALSERGVWGFVGVDFLAEPAVSGSRVYLGEINLRMGATAPPNLYLRMLLGADAQDDLSADGDALPNYVARQVRAVPGRCPAAGRPAFDPDARHGVVPYCVDPEDPSKAWLLAVGNSRKEALRLLEHSPLDR